MTSVIKGNLCDVQRGTLKAIRNIFMVKEMVVLVAIAIKAMETGSVVNTK